MKYLDLDPENQVRIILARTESKSSGVLISTPAISRGAFDNKAAIIGIGLRLKGKLEGSTDFHFFTPKIFVYANSNESRIDYRLQFLENLIGSQAAVPPLYWALLDAKALAGS